jgi:hypothetical protein
MIKWGGSYLNPTHPEFPLYTSRILTFPACGDTRPEGHNIHRRNHPPCPKSVIH